MTLLECLGAGRAGRDLLFALVQHRFTLVPLEGAEKPHWQFVMERNEKFADSRRVHPPTPGVRSAYEDFLDWQREYGAQRTAR